MMSPSKREKTHNNATHVAAGISVATSNVVILSVNGTWVNWSHATKNLRLPKPHTSGSFANRGTGDTGTYMALRSDNKASMVANTQVVHYTPHVTCCRTSSGPCRPWVKLTLYSLKSWTTSLTHLMEKSTGKSSLKRQTYPVSGPHRSYCWDMMHSNASSPSGQLHRQLGQFPRSIHRQLLVALQQAGAAMGPQICQAKRLWVTLLLQTVLDDAELYVQHHQGNGNRGLPPMMDEAFVRAILHKGPATSEHAHHEPRLTYGPLYWVSAN